MRVMGIAVEMTRPNHPTAHVAVVEGSYASPSLVAQFDLTSPGTDRPALLLQLGLGLRSHIDGHKPDHVAIRTADHAPIARSSEGPRLRLMAEGALAAAAREKLNAVTVASGRGLANSSRAVNKAALDAYAASHFPDAQTQAVAAALSMLP